MALRTKYGALPNVTWHDPVPREVAQDMMHRCDALYVGFKSSPLYELSGVSPNKFFDYCAAARPVLEVCDEAFSLTDKAQNGLRQNPGDPVRLAQTLNSLMQLTPSELTAMGQRGREWVLKEASPAVLAERFISAVAAAS